MCEVFRRVLLVIDMYSNQHLNCYARSVNGWLSVDIFSDFAIVIVYFVELVLLYMCNLFVFESYVALWVYYWTHHVTVCVQS